MIDANQSIELIAQAYYNATLENADMQTAVNTLESIRKSIIDNEDQYKIGIRIDNSIGEMEDEHFLNVLVQFRSQFLQQLHISEIARLHTAFKNNLEEGWKEWLRTYACAFSEFQFTHAQHLSEEPFSFPVSTEQVVERIRQLSRLAKDRSLPDAYDTIIYLADQECISNLIRAKILVTAAEIQLYDFFNLEVGRDLLQRAKDLAPEEDLVLIGWGEYWLNIEKPNYDEAKILFEKVIRNDSVLTNGYTWMGEWYEMQNPPDLEAAEDWYIEGTKRRSGHCDSYFKLLRLYGRPEKLPYCEPKLERLLKQIISVEPNAQYDAFVEMGIIYQKDKNYDKAHYWYNKAIHLDTTRTYGFTNEGDCYIEEKNYQKGKISFDGVIRLAPESFAGYWGMAWLYEQRGLSDEASERDLDEAVDWYKISLKHRPSWEGIIRGKINDIRLLQKKYPVYEEELLQALQSNPADQATLVFLYNLVSELIKSDSPAPFRILKKIRKVLGKSYEAEYHSRLAEVHKQLGDWENALKEVSSAYNIDNDEEKFRRETALIFNEEGNELYYQADFRKSIEKYRNAKELSPNDDVIISNLAEAWINLNEPGKRIEYLDFAIRELKKAQELNPAFEEYQEKIEKLERAKKIIEYFGERTLEKFPFVNPFTVEFAENLLPFIGDLEEGELTLSLSNLIEDMRTEIYQITGCESPPINFRLGTRDFPDGGICIIINEIPHSQWIIPVEKRLYPGPITDLSSLGISGEEVVNPRTRENATLIQSQDWDKVVLSNRPLWEVNEYMIGILERIILKNLGELFGYQETENLLNLYKISEKINDRPADITEITLLNKSLLNDAIPILNLERILEKFNEMKKGTKLVDVLEAIRSIPEINRTLPGNNDKYFFYQIDSLFEEKLKKSAQQAISVGDWWVFPDSDSDSILGYVTSIKEGIESEGNVAILVENSKVRLFVKQMINVDLPFVPVLSKMELLPVLEKNIMGKIVLS
jgi:tetratricopeptide (TPR) repeat protein